MSAEKCRYCEHAIGHEHGMITVDHVIALSKGGKNIANNRVYSCERCNTYKSNLTLPRFIDKVGRSLKFSAEEKTIVIKNATALMVSIMPNAESITKPIVYDHTQICGSCTNQHGCSILGECFYNRIGAYPAAITGMLVKLKKSAPSKIPISKKVKQPKQSEQEKLITNPGKGVIIGKLNDIVNMTGVRGYSSARSGTPVYKFASIDRYVIYFPSTKGSASVLPVAYYPHTLKNKIDFINPKEKESIPLSFYEMAFANKPTKRTLEDMLNDPEPNFHEKETLEITYRNGVTQKYKVVDHNLYLRYRELLDLVNLSETDRQEFLKLSIVMIDFCTTESPLYKSLEKQVLIGPDCKSAYPVISKLM